MTEITKGDVSADIMNLLALKDHYEGRKEKEESVITLKALIDKITKKIDEYEPARKNKTQSLVDPKSIVMELKKVRISKLVVLESQEEALERGFNAAQFSEVIKTTRLSVLSKLPGYGPTLQHLEALPRKSEFEKHVTVRL
jgi:hypothetical protein